MYVNVEKILPRLLDDCTLMRISVVLELSLEDGGEEIPLLFHSLDGVDVSIDMQLFVVIS